MTKENFVNFYPTPERLLEKVTHSVDWEKIQTVLEPSAGKGDIVDFAVKKAERTYNRNFDVDCIEINADLRAALSGKEYKVIADDFLKFRTFKKYDLILMNPPFDAGAEHLMKALEIQKNGGRVICILNAETIRNPYTNLRKALLNKLEKYDAAITYMEEEFVSAERRTKVEIAVVDVTIPDDCSSSFIFESLKRKYIKDTQCDEQITDVATADYIRSAVQQFQIECEAGIKLIREYKAMSPYILARIEKEDSDKYYNKPLLELKVGGEDLSENRYVKLVREKYWEALFMDERFTKGMPHKMYQEYRNRIHELSNYDFSYYNIKEIQIQICQSLVSGIEDSIMRLFDELSYTHSWMPESSKNIHYYNGWATNKAWYVNKKVILPVSCWSDIWKEFRYGYEVTSKIMDIEKAFDYLAGIPGRTSCTPNILSHAERNSLSKNIETRYFTLTFYKKGTMHIVFKDIELLKRLNIYGGRGKNMLPPRYGKVPYDHMTPEEQEVVNEFDGGKDEYTKVYENRDSYLFEVDGDTVLQIAG